MPGWDCGRLLAADGTVIEREVTRLEREGIVPPDLEDRVVAAFEAEISPVPPATTTPNWLPRVIWPKPAPLITATVVAVVLSLRTFNLHVFGESSSLARSLSALWQAVMRTPQYSGVLGNGNVLADNNELLATVHKLTTLYVETALWTTLMFVLGLMVIDQFRRGTPLARRALA